MPKIIGFQEKCIGCRLCDVACRVSHSGTDNVLKAYANPALGPSRINIQDSDEVSFALPCRNCDEPRCVAACITGAMTIEAETGKIVHDADKCLGCWSCIMVCPYGAISMDTSGTKVASKCDLCAQKGAPACVEACPNLALAVDGDDNDD